MSIVQDVVTLINSGWRLFQGEVDRSVYEKQACPSLVNKRTYPKWFFLGDKFLCIGCPKKCGLIRPTGFQAQLEINYSEKAGEQYKLTPDEMLAKFKLLKVPQVAYCLNISEQKVYKMIAYSELPSIGRPVRVPTEAVISFLKEQLDE